MSKGYVPPYAGTSKQGSLFKPVSVSTTHSAATSAVTSSSPPSSNASSATKKAWGEQQRCYHSHKPLEIVPGKFVYGGSCISPCVHDADIYIGFETGMKFTHRHLPWNEGHEINFPIPDRQTPGDLTTYMELLNWTAEQINAGKKVHAGCIGGHGRTGMFFAALRKIMANDENASQYVRDNYCEKAVESKSQVDFLEKKFGITPVKPHDSYSTSKSGGSVSTSKDERMFSYVKAKGTIWGKDIVR